jgi:tRNA threonylcarbamoyladenosine biosynthesis protein TsaB
MGTDKLRVLAIESARDACSVAVLRNDGSASSATNLRPRSHAEQLVPMAVGAVELAGLQFDEIDVIAVSAGPGSYTGLRIGVSAAKGFATAYGADLVAVGTLHAYAFTVASTMRLYGRVADRIAVALVARQAEIYFALFDAASGPSGPSVLAEPSVRDLADVARELSSVADRFTTVVAGDAAGKIIRGASSNSLLREWRFIPTALSVGEIAIVRARAGHFDDVTSFEPHYLKDYVAETGRSVFDRLPP